jgi:flagellar hook-associated protein 2
LPPLEIPELPSGNPQLQKALNKIVRIEQKPIDKVDEKIAQVDNKMGLIKDLKTKFNDIKGALTPFKSVKDFRDLKAFSSHPDIVNPSSIDKDKAQPGTFELEVVSLAQSSSLMTTGVADKNQTELGVGWITFRTPEGGTEDIYINSENNTLEGIASTVNNAGLGVRAQVVNDGTDSSEPWRLILYSEKTGWKNDYDWADFNFLDGDIDLDRYRQREASSAVIKVNGQPLYVDQNTVKDMLPGVTLDLKKAVEGQVVKIEVKPDVEKIEVRAKELVDKLNGVLSFFQQQSQLDSQSRKDPKKALAGDTSLQSIQYRMREILQKSNISPDSDEAVQVSRLGDIGIAFNKTGTLEYDAKKFQSALEKNFDEVAKLVSGDSPLNGFANEMTRLIDGVVRTGDGLITIRERGFNQAKERLEKEKESKTVRAESRVKRAQIQFGRAEQAMQQLQSMGNSIASTIGAVGGG